MQLRNLLRWLCFHNPNPTPRGPNPRGLAKVQLTEQQEKTKQQLEKLGFKVYFCYQNSLHAEVLVMAKRTESTFIIRRILPDGTTWNNQPKQ